MKNVKVYVLGSVLSALLCSNLNAADFSSRSDAELVKLSGIVKVEEFVEKLCRKFLILTLKTKVYENNNIYEINYI